MHDPGRFAGLIFDCDGTLADTMPAHFAAWTHTLSRYGIAFPEERFYSLGGVPTQKIVNLLAEQHGVRLDAAAVAAEKEAAFWGSLGSVRAVEPVAMAAARFRGVKPMAVASGGLRHVVQATLQHLGMADWFGAVVCAEDTAGHKPEPDVFLEAARRLGVEPGGCLVYEDTDIGIEAARRAGMQWVDVRRLVRP